MGGDWLAGRARHSHSATLLSNGKVLLVGGAGSNGTLRSAELYDPATGKFTATNGADERALLSHGDLVAQRQGAGGGRDGHVGAALSSAELYDPATGKWTATGAMNQARARQSATLLPNGQVLAVEGTSDGTNPLYSAEQYDPATRSWTTLPDLLTVARYGHTASLLPSGKLLVAGGFSFGDYLASAAECDPASGTWTATGGLSAARRSHTATLLPSGKVLVEHRGLEWGRYRPAVQRRVVWSGCRDLDDDSPIGHRAASHTATLLSNGGVLAAGGDANGVNWRALRRGCRDLEDHRCLTTARKWGHTGTLLPTGRCWWQAAARAVECFRARSCTVQPRGPGHRPAR